VVGRVVDAATGRPVGGAIASINSATSVVGTPSPGTSASRRVVADDQGRFLFRNLAKGTYTFTASASGYLDGGYGTRRPGGSTVPFTLAEDERVGDITIRLWRSATIGGKVTDETGDPIVGVSVSLVRQEDAGGTEQASAQQSGGYPARTDDRGIYQMTDLVPGSYLVAVPSRMTALPLSLVDADAATLGSFRASGSPSLSMGMSALSAGVRLGEFVVQTNAQGNFGGSNALIGRLPTTLLPDGRVMAYPTTFYPSAVSAAEAQPITVGPGEERQDVDLRLRPVAMVRLSGSVIGPTGPEPHFAVHLIPAYAANQPLERTHEAAVTATDARGTFAFPAVAPGQYLLKAWRLTQALVIAADALPQDSTLWGEMPVDVGENPLAAVTVALHPGNTFSGRVEFDGTAPRPAPQQVQVLLSVCFEPSWAAALASRLATRVSASGKFVTQGVPPGRYVLRLPNQFLSKGWYFESATLDGRDLTISPLVLDVGNVSGIVIRFSDRRTELAGTVRDANNRPDPNASVLLFPADYETWIQNGMSPLAAYSVPTSESGTYSVGGIRPGEYLAAAIAADQQDDWRQASRIRALVGGATRVTLPRGETHRLELRSRDAR
jgi:hypothetical protein